MANPWEKDLRDCQLCEHRCGVNRAAGERGVCGVTGPVVATRMLHPAPPESYTVFVSGCNFKCLHCQNHGISMYPDNGARPDGFVEPKALAREAIDAMASPQGMAMKADRLFFSGGEPTIHLPYIEAVVSEGRKLDPDLKVNFDTNGYMTEDSLRRVFRFTTSITFDLKAFSDESSQALTGTPAGPVLRNAKILAREAPEKLWEFRIVVIPGINEEDVPELCRFVAGISPKLPVYFLAFRPHFVLDTHPGADQELLRRCVAIARSAGLINVGGGGSTGLPGRIQAPESCLTSAYKNDGPRLAASYAYRLGCNTHPRDCGTCETSDACPLRTCRKRGN